LTLREIVVKRITSTVIRFGVNNEGVSGTGYRLLLN